MRYESKNHFDQRRQGVQSFTDKNASHMAYGYEVIRSNTTCVWRRKARHHQLLITPELPITLRSSPARPINMQGPGILEAFKMVTKFQGDIRNSVCFAEFTAFCFDCAICERPDAEQHRAQPTDGQLRQLPVPLGAARRVRERRARRQLQWQRQV